MEKMIIELVEVLLDRAEKDIDLLMPGYTHLQRAQVFLYSIKVALKFNHLLTFVFLI